MLDKLLLLLFIIIKNTLAEMVKKTRAVTKDTGDFDAKSWLEASQLELMLSFPIYYREYCCVSVPQHLWKMTLFCDGSLSCCRLHVGHPDLHGTWPVPQRCMMVEIEMLDVKCHTAPLVVYHIVLHQSEKIISPSPLLHGRQHIFSCTD